MGGFLLFFITTFLHWSHAISGSDIKCNPVKFNYSSVACLCDANYCDKSYPDLPPMGQFLHVTSSMEGLRFDKAFGLIQEFNGLDDDCDTVKLDYNKKRLVLKVETEKTYQQILGFGGAFTDSAGYVISTLSREVQETLMKSIFSESGLNYNMGRVPIGGTDFSLRAYTLDDADEDDMELKYFQLQPEDYNFKIPYIKRAMELSSEKLLLISAVWSPPLFMKNVHTYVGISHVKKEYYKSFANYHIRFLEEYKKNNIEFWAITPGNEPTNGLFGQSIGNVNDVGWIASDMADFVGEYFGPILKNSIFNSTKLLLLDDKRSTLLEYLTVLLSYESAVKYMDGIAFHTYYELYVNLNKLSEFAEDYPDRLIALTETCEGAAQDFYLKKGEWRRAEIYAKKIMEAFKHFSSTFIDWNLALDLNGGPSYLGTVLDSLIFVDTERNRFYHQTSYYGVGHFSKYIPRGSVRVNSEELSRSDVDSIAFLRPDGLTTVVLINGNTNPVQATIWDGESRQIVVTLSQKSISTIVY